MPVPKGTRIGGRRKGTPNKISADLKSMILGALAAKGGENYLVEQATENPVAFLTLIGKVLPLTLQGDPERPIAYTVVTGVPRTDAEAQAIIAHANGRDTADEFPDLKK